MINEKAQKQIDYIAERCKEIRPFVVIRSITYNHEPYLKDALEGFVMQKTIFPFVAIVHEDASTDGNAEVLREYAEKFPDIIFPIYEEENQYSKQDGSITRIMNEACFATGAKYASVCEGDDYWTDPYKLQKQVDFLESHPDYAMCFTNALEKWENKKGSEYVMNMGKKNRDYTALEIYNGFRIPTATVIFNINVIKNSVYNNLQKIKKPAFGDLQLFMSCALAGKVRYLHEITSCYRRLESGAAYQFEKKQWNHIRTRIEVSKILGPQFMDQERELTKKYFLPTFKKSFEYFPNNIILLGRIFWFNPLGSIKELKWIVKSFKNKIQKIEK